MRFAWIALLAAMPLFATDPPEGKPPVDAVQKLFDAMAAHDEAAIRNLLLPEGRIAVIREDGKVTGSTHAEFAARIGASKAALLERMWDVQVTVQGNLASVWAPYDFHRDGKFSHCGIDQVTLLKTADGWKIASIVYTMQTTGCAPSPLGPPKP